MEALDKDFFECDKVKLERANANNVQILIKWTLDPIAQGPFKVVPNMTKEQLQELFLDNLERYYYLIKDEAGKPVGRFYYRAWRFDRKDEKIDWELNLFIANPDDRGKGYGTAAQLLVSNYLLQLSETHSVFAYTMNSNIGEQKSLDKCGFKLLGNLPDNYYKIDMGNLNPKNYVLYAIVNS